MKKLSVVIGIVSILSFLLAACGPIPPTAPPVEKQFLPPLLCYSLGESKPPDVNTKFQTKTQFREEKDLALKQLEMLCEPTAKAEKAEAVGKLPRVNPLACYSLQAGSEPVNRRVTLSSANNIYAGEVDVEARWLFCDPVYSKSVWEKPADNKPFEFPLLFYKISLVEPQGIELSIFATDQFIEVQEIPLLRTDSLAEPVIKTLDLEGAPKDPPGDVYPYVCFSVDEGKVMSLDLTVTLKDQFHSEPFDVAVKNPVIFCDPAVKKE